MTAADPAWRHGNAPVPASGDVDGDGRGELVVGVEAVGGRPREDEIAVYRLTESQPAEHLATGSAFDRTGRSGSGNLLVGDVIPSEPGDEIVVAEDGSGRRATHIRVFGGLARGPLRPLRTLRALNSRLAVHEPLPFALGNVFPEAEHPGLEIVVGDRRGYVQVFDVAAQESIRLRRIPVFSDVPRVAASVLAVGDLLPGIAGDEIAVADAGGGHEGLIRVLNARAGTILIEFAAFSAPAPAAGIELWIGDVIAGLPGAELLVGQGLAGGRVRVFSFATGVPIPLFDLPPSPSRQTTLARHLAIGDLVPNLPGNEVAVAQPDARVAVEIFHLDAHGAERCATVGVSDLTDTVGAITVGRRR